MFLYVLGSIGQWLSFIMLTGGIVIEIQYQADIGFVAITCGSALFAFVTKIKEIGADQELKRIKRDAFRTKHERIST